MAPPKTRTRGHRGHRHHPRYTGVAVHDCWASYLSYTHCGHALCGAHLLRELTFIVDAPWLRLGQAHAPPAPRHPPRSRQTQREDSEHKRVQGRTETLPHPPHPGRARAAADSTSAKRPTRPRRQVRCPQPVGADEEVRKRRALVRQQPDVAFTNNRAERDLRMAKVKQKVSGCFRTRKYAEAYCRISSYLQSMANQGYNPLVAIQIALAGRAVDNLPE